MTDRGRLLRGLASAARADRPTGADRARIRSRLAARFAVAPDSGIRHAHSAANAWPSAPTSQAAATLPPAAAAPIGAMGSGAAKSATVIAFGKAAGVAVAIAAVSFAGGYAVGVHETSRTAHPAATEAAVEPSVGSRAPSPVATMGSPPETVLDPTAAPPPLESLLAPPTRTAPERASASRSMSSEHPAAGLLPSSLADETALLAEAQTALRDGDAARALERLDALAARHPAGALGEERIAVRILALCAAGRTAEARAEAGRFLAQSPSSVHADRVRASCAFAEPANP